ncbi:hypothetical protein GCM10028895_13230 [Pontibacter rugosus]
MMPSLEPSCKEQLEQLKKEFDEFAYIVSHDLKAPVRAVTNLSTWIEEDLGDDLAPDIKHNMDLLRSRASRLERMIEGLLTFSRSTRLELEVGLTDVSALLQEVKQSISPHITLHVPESICNVLTYKAKLREVLTHVLQNAVAFNDKAQPEIVVTLSEQEHMLLFSISDNGIGIPEEALQKVFTLFYTVAPKDSVDTIGTGLAISKK